MKLSIITIAKDNLDGLCNTMASVANQTWRDFEYIIVDGASTDGSVEAIKQFEQDNEKSAQPIVLKWVSEPDKGIYNAMNKGTLMAEGEYCLYLNSGDCLYEADTLQKSFALNKNYDIFWGKMLFVSSDGSKDIRCTDRIDLDPFMLFLQTIPHQSCFIKRSVLLEENMYDEKYRIVSDHKLLYKTVVVDKRPSAFIDVLVSVMDGNGISSNLELCRREDDALFCEFFPSWLLASYHDWRDMREKISMQERYIKSYHNAIAVYEYIKDKTLYGLPANNAKFCDEFTKIIDKLLS